MGKPAFSLRPVAGSRERDQPPTVKIEDSWTVPEPFSELYLTRLNRVYRWVLPPAAVFVAMSAYAWWQADTVWSGASLAQTVLLVSMWFILFRFPSQTLPALHLALYGCLTGSMIQLTRCYAFLIVPRGTDEINWFLGEMMLQVVLYIVAAHTFHGPALARLSSLSIWLLSSSVAGLGMIYSWTQLSDAHEVEFFTLRFVIVGSIAFGMTTIFSHLYSFQVGLQVQTALLRRYALTDSLTGLPNRRAFESALGVEYASARRHEHPLSLLLADADDFKRINDSHGHDRGDEILVQLARVLSGVVRASDHLARWGGEEFVAILPLTDLAQATVMAERLRSSVASHDFGVGKFTISVGVAELKGSESPTSLFRRADQALHEAKVRGRNCVFAADRRGRLKVG